MFYDQQYLSPLTLSNGTTLITYDSLIYASQYSLLDPEHDVEIHGRKKTSSRWTISRTGTDGLKTLFGVGRPGKV